MRRLNLLLVAILCILFLVSCNMQKDVPPPIFDETPKIYTAADGVAVIKLSEIETPTKSEKGNLTPETIWEDKAVSEENFTLPSEEILKQDGSLGTLSIPKITLQMSVFEAEDTMEAMKKGAALFKSTSIWNGNVGLSAHNGGVADAVSFGRLNELDNGDSIIYVTGLGKRSYTVTDIKVISDEDWSYLSRTEDNRITLITCVNGKPDKRLMVQATQA